jgi:hypothetical protein
MKEEPLYEIEIKDDGVSAYIDHIVNNIESALGFQSIDYSDLKEILFRITGILYEKGTKVYTKDKETL